MADKKDQRSFEDYSEVFENSCSFWQCAKWKATRIQEYFLNKVL